MADKEGAWWSERAALYRLMADQERARAEACRREGDAELARVHADNAALHEAVAVAFDGHGGAGLGPRTRPGPSHRA